MKGFQENKDIWKQEGGKLGLKKKYKNLYGRDGREKQKGRLGRSKIMERRSYLDYLKK